MTSMMTGVGGETVRDALVSALEAASDFNSADVVGPEALLWPDTDSAWADVVAALAHELPILVLGEHDPQRDRGPVPWLRMELANRNAGSLVPRPVIVYLPGVSRKALTDPSDLSEELQPLAGLVVRSAIFNQRNGSDWTPSAFLMNEVQGLGLTVSANKGTKEALTRSFPRLLDVQVRDLRGRTLDSSDFDKLLVDDPARQLLMWLNDSAGYQLTLEGKGEWDGFVSLVRKDYKVDLVRDGALRAAQLLGDRDGKWSDVWNRFADAPQGYPGVVSALRAAKPDGMLSLHPDSWPQDNDEAEAEALATIDGLVSASVGEIQSRLAELRISHADRLQGVWAKLGQTPGACLVDRLAGLAKLTGSIGAASDVGGIASEYVQSGWRTDDSFLSVLSALEPGHANAPSVEKVAESLYRPWLVATVEKFQSAWSANPPTGPEPGLSADEPSGTCALFVDGLRFDVASGLSEMLVHRGLTTDLEWGIAGVPTVTATCKPAVSPTAPLLRSGPELSPSTATGGSVNQDVLKKSLAGQGWAFIPEDSVGDPSGRGWTEGGDIDALGHSFGVKLAHQLPDQIRQLATRISELLNAGWQRVVVVTDHGWLLLPGQLPKHHLPEHLAVVRKGRCARLNSGVEPVAGLSVLPWRWDADVQIALAPGIHAFEAGKVYEHGGLSPQESVVPRLVVTKPFASKPAAITIDFSWIGLTLKVQVVDPPEGCSVDIRGKANDGSTSLATAPRALSDGKVRLMVDDEHQGQAAVIVIVGADDELLAATPTLIPEG
jgi:hypothetical protein